MKRVACYTLGCKVNSYESEAMLEQFERAGFTVVQPDEGPDVCLINTCTVTQIAARKSRQIISRMRALNKNALIVACGCYVEQERSADHASPSREDLNALCDLMITNREKENIVRLVGERLSLMEIPPTMDQAFYISSTGSKARAFLKVQDGCRQFCTYCIIPFVRGPLRSKNPDEAVEEARVLVQSGCREIVLTGIHLTSYGRDLDQQTDLGDLICRLNEIEGLYRIRLGSLEVGLITKEFLEKVSGCAKLCPHFHLSLQSGAVRTLKAMNRHYTPEQFEQAVELLRQTFPDAAVTTDIICGFPGETPEDHSESMAFVRRVGFRDLHVFPYSAREGTAAALRKDQLPADVKNSRAHEMMALGREMAASFAKSLIGSKVQVLLERQENECWEGYTPDYMKVRLEGRQDFLRNQIVPVKIQRMEWDKNDIVLTGEYDHERKQNSVL